MRGTSATPIRRVKKFRTIFSVASLILFAPPSFTQIPNDPDLVSSSSLAAEKRSDTLAFLLQRTQPNAKHSLCRCRCQATSTMLRYFL